MWQAVVSDVPLLYTLSGFSSVVFIHMRNTTNNSSIQREKKTWDDKYNLRRNYL